MSDETISWIDMEEELPDDSINVLIFGYTMATSDHRDVWIAHWDSESGCWRHDNGGRAFLITHWSNMPTGPKGDD